MKFSRLHYLFLIVIALLGLSAPLTSRAALSVTGAGLPSQDFTATPLPTEWAGGLMTGDGTRFTTEAALDAAIQTNTAAGISLALPTSATDPPSTSAVSFRHNTARGAIQSRPTTGTAPNDCAAVTLKATLHNDAGGNITSMVVSYDMGTQTPLAGEVVGWRVFYSLTGAASSWQPIGALSGVEGTTTMTATLDLSATPWPSGTDMYIIWADDNANGITDPSYTLDNFAISSVVVGGGPVPLSIVLTAPASGAVVFAPGPVTLTANVGGTTPPTEVIFFANGGEISRDATAPYSATLPVTPGTYTLSAEAYNATEIADSATVTITVRDEFVSYPGGTISQNFDSMGTAGVESPTGWYVGAALPTTSFTVMPGDGSAGANGAVLGWNYGSSGNNDRALGTAPTGADRNIEARIKNNTGSNITAFAFHYDGETWRNYTNAVDGWLTNFVSYDLGATWIATGFDFDQPTARVEPQGAVDGDAAGNRTAGIGGIITPPAPVPPGSVIYIRWQDFNGNGVTDGGLAVDNFTFQGTGFSQAVLGVNITAPTSGQTVDANCAGQAAVTASAVASPGGANTITNVSFKLDAGVATNDTVAPYSVIFSNVALGPHTILVTAKDSSGASVNSSVNFTVGPNVAPVINYTNVHSGAVVGTTFSIGNSITNNFGITDDGTLTLVEFLVNNTVIYATNINYGTMVVNNALAGTSTYTVRATDNCGNVTTASKVITVTTPAVTMIVTNGSLWKYSNLGSQPANDGGGKQWFESGYDDSAWPSGFAELGGGDAVTPPGTVPEKTVIDIGAGTRFNAVYFRKTFTASAASALTVAGLIDDGAVVYLNGAIVATLNMTGAGPFAYTDLAPGTLADDGTAYYQSNITASVVAGVNTLAVEVHQNATTSSDLTFDLMLWSNATGPHLNIALEGANVHITWTGGGTLQFTDDMNDAPVWTTQATGQVGPGDYVIPHNQAHRYYSLKP